MVTSALLVAIVAAAPWAFVSGTPVAVLFTIPLIPVAVTVAIIRHQLLDIRLAISRLLAWMLLSLAVVVAYGALVAVLDRFISAQSAGPRSATVLLVLLAAPLLPRLQRLVERAVYGDRSNPARVVSRVGEQLATPMPACSVSSPRYARRYGCHTSPSSMKARSSPPTVNRRLRCTPGH